MSPPSREPLTFWHFHLGGGLVTPPHKNPAAAVSFFEKSLFFVFLVSKVPLAKSEVEGGGESREEEEDGAAGRSRSQNAAAERR